MSLFRIGGDIILSMVGFAVETVTGVELQVFEDAQDRLAGDIPFFGELNRAVNDVDKSLQTTLQYGIGASDAEFATSKRYKSKYAAVIALLLKAAEKLEKEGEDLANKIDSSIDSGDTSVQGMMLDAGAIQRMVAACWDAIKTAKDAHTQCLQSMARG